VKKFQIQIFLLLATISSAPALFCAHEAGQLPRLTYTQDGEFKQNVFGNNRFALPDDLDPYSIPDSDDMPPLEPLSDSDLESCDEFSIHLPPQLLKKSTALPEKQEVYFFELVPYDEKNWSSKEQEYSLVSSLLQPKKPAKPTARSEKKESKLAASSQETPLMSPRLTLPTSKSLFAADNNKPLSQPQVWPQTKNWHSTVALSPNKEKTTAMMAALDPYLSNEIVRFIVAEYAITTTGDHVSPEKTLRVNRELGFRLLSLPNKLKQAALALSREDLTKFKIIKDCSENIIGINLDFYESDTAIDIFKQIQSRFYKMLKTQKEDKKLSKKYLKKINMNVIVSDLIASGFITENLFEKDINHKTCINDKDTNRLAYFLSNNSPHGSVGSLLIIREQKENESNGESSSDESSDESSSN